MSLGDEGPKGKALILWVTILGKSRIARKTVSARRYKEVIKSINKDILLPNDFTPPKLVSILAEKESGEPCCWTDDECSRFFKQVKDQKYMSDAPELLSKTYDGDSFTRGTQARGIEEVNEPHLICFLFSTEYLPKHFTEEHLMQGFLNRFIFAPLNRKSRKAKRTVLMKAERDEWQEIVKWYRALADMDDSVPLLTPFDNKAKKMYDDYEEEIEELIENGLHPATEGWIGNMPEQVLRIAGLYRLGRCDIGYLQQTAKQRRPFLEIEEEDMKKAIALVAQARTWFDQTLHLMVRSVPHIRLALKDQPTELVIQAIQNHGVKSPNNKPEIMKANLTHALKNKLKAPEYKPALQQLIDEGIVKEFVRGTATYYELQTDKLN
jgi:hypothetical protein